VGTAQVGIILCGCGDPLGELLDLVPIPAAFRTRMLAMVVADTAMCWAAERGARWLLPSSSTRPKRLHADQATAAAADRNKKTK
jgi:hypothetical protein